MSILLLVLGLVLFVGLVVVHEFGHFIMARRGGVTVEEFGIGFPPRLFKRRTKGGWLFTMNLLPLGGFVKLKGEHDSDTAAGSLGAASVATKTKIMAAGVVMNLLAAYVLLVILAFVGMPQLIDNQFTIARDAHYMQRAQTYVAVDTVERDSPAASAGIHADDVVTAMGPAGHLTPLKSADALPALAKQYAGQTIQIQIRKGNTGAVQERTVSLRSAAAVAAAKAAGRDVGYLGVVSYEGRSGLTVVRSTWSAPVVAGGIIAQFTVLTMQSLGKAVAGLGSIVAGSLSGNRAARQAGQTEASSQVSGPLGIYFIFQYGSSLGLRFILMLVAILSLTLAIMNILPIPALDGGRLWLMLFTRAIRRPLSPRGEEVITTTGFAMLVGLIILVTIVDAKRFF